MATFWKDNNVLKCGEKLVENSKSEKREALRKFAVTFFKMLLDHYRTFHDENFIEQLLLDGTRQQAQYLRRLARRIKPSEQFVGETGIWEHIIPINYFKKTLKIYILEGKEEKGIEFIDWYYNNALQVFIPVELDRQLKGKLKTNMPEGWNWETGDIWARYIESGIDWRQLVTFSA